MSKLKKFKSKFTKLFLPTLLIVLALLIFYVSVIFTFSKKIFPNTYIAGIYVGNMSVQDAQTILQKDLQFPSKVQLTANGNYYDLDTKEVKLNYDVQQTVLRAYNFTNSGNLLNDLIIKTQLVIKPIDLGLALTYDEKKLDETLAILSTKIGQEPVYPNVSADDKGHVLVNPGKDGIIIDLQKTKTDLLTGLSEGKFDNKTIYLKNVEVELDRDEALVVTNRAQKLLTKQLLLKLGPDTIEIPKNKVLSFLDYGNKFDLEKIKTYSNEVAKKLNRSAQDSVFVVKDGKVQEFTPSKDGLVVSEDQLTNLIFTNLSVLENSLEESLSLNIPVETTPAKIKNEDVNNLGIKELLGKGTSHFKGSIPNRIHNVNLAQSRFKGVLVPPGETFSFNQYLGDVSSLTGYKAAYVIKDGKTVLGDGGGVCQVSTTLFRAILAAGLPIVERRPHSYRVGYYEQGFPPGLDATVYYPTTDLKFKNDTLAHLLIQPIIDLSTLTLDFEIYGTNDGRVAKTSKPVITSSIAPAPDLYVDDPTIPTGQIRQIEHKAWGARVVFDYKVTRAGETLIDQKFVSGYRPWQAVFLRGTGPAI